MAATFVYSVYPAANVHSPPQSFVTRELLPVTKIGPRNPIREFIQIKKFRILSKNLTIQRRYCEKHEMFPV